MRARELGYTGLIAAALLIAPAGANAQTDSEALRKEIESLRQQLLAMQQEYNERLATLEAKLDAAESSVPSQPAGAVPSAITQLPAGASKVFNPDIAVVGNVLGAIGRNSVNPPPALQMQEAEVSFQAIVDPYARADFFVAVGEEGAELEEGFVTFPALPGGVLAKVGKQRAAFGKVNTFHTHQITWTDRPLVVENLLGGDEGISDAGVSLSRLIANPWFFLEATGQVFRGDSGDLFRSSTRGDLAYAGRIRGYQDLSESTNIDLGASVIHGHNASGIVDGVDEGRFTTRLLGVDGTVRWKPLRRAIYRSFVGRTELVWSRRNQPLTTQRAFGYYVSGDYQLARRWFAGARIDRSERADDAALRDSGQSLVLTFWPSEFGQVRGQYRRTRYAAGDRAHEFLFQFQFSIGAHGAHPY